MGRVAERYGIKISLGEIKTLKSLRGKTESENNAVPSAIAPLTVFCDCAQALSIELWLTEGRDEFEVFRQAPPYCERGRSAS